MLAGLAVVNLSTSESVKQVNSEKSEYWAAKNICNLIL